MLERGFMAQTHRRKKQVRSSEECLTKELRHEHKVAFVLFCSVELIYVPNVKVCLVIQVTLLSIRFSISIFTNLSNHWLVITVWISLSHSLHFYISNLRQ